MTLALEAEGIEHRIEGGSRTLLDGIDLAVAPGTSVSVQGRSGSGKSTLLSILGLLLRPDHGTVRIEGERADDLPDGRRAGVRRQSVGFVFQNYSLVASRPAWQNVTLPLMAASRPEARAHRDRARQALAQVGLEHRADAMPSELSGGEQQRVAIARALINDPAVILADEPTGSLDVATGEEVMDLLLARVQEAQAALILVTHDPEIAQRADQQWELRDGRLHR